MSMTDRTPLSARRRPLTAMALVLALAVGGAGMLAEARAETQPRQARAEVVIGWADLIEQVAPAVVSVRSVREGPAPRLGMREAIPGWPEGDSPMERFMRRFFGEDFEFPGPREFGMPERGEHPERGMRPMEGIGSGFIIDPAGYVVTNHHVVQGAERLEVTMKDGRRFDAELVGSDAHTDLALLRIEADDPLPWVAWGDSDAVRVGDPVAAVGNPFGLGGTVTAGVISATGRDLGAGPYDDFLQIDAAINRGNSGGPTFGLDGLVIGVNSAIYSPTGMHVGIGFAIPANLAQRVIEDLRDKGVVERGWLGVQIQAIDEQLARALELDEPKGALVAQVTPGSPAFEAGVERGDIIVRFNGQEVTAMRELPTLVAARRPGTEAEVTVLREGEEVTLAVTLGTLPPPDQLAAAAPAPETPEPQLGMQLAPLTPEARESHGVPAATEGVLVTGVEPGSAAAQRGMRTGDVILEVAREKVSEPAEVSEAIRKAAEAGSDTVLMLVQREGNDRFVAVPVAGA
jgi:serine protease Do